MEQVYKNKQNQQQYTMNDDDYKLYNLDIS